MISLSFFGGVYDYMKKTITVRHTSIIVTNYELGENKNLENMLSIWDPIYYKMDTPGFFYNAEKKQLYLPRGIDLNYLERAFGVRCKISYEHDPVEPASFRLLKEPRNDIQRKSISFLLGEGEFRYAKKYSQQALDLDTGDGKTYCVIAALTFLKMKAIIITPNDNIKKQWIKSIINMTDLKEPFIFNISGSDAIRKLLSMKKIPYKVFFVNHQTIHSFAKKEGWDAVGEFFVKLGIGVKVYDEAHFNFENMIYIDLHTNTKKTIYLTANFERSHFRENIIFERCFKNVPKFGKEMADEKRKHIIAVIVRYKTRPDMGTKAAVKGVHGFDRNRYIDYQIGQELFYKKIMEVLNFIGDKEGKIVIYLSKNNAIDTLYDFLMENYDKRTPMKYNSTISPEEKEKALNSELILTTPKSLGTGSDIPGLRFIINTEQYTSPITANQMQGRLREYAKDKFTFYFDLVDVGFPQTEGMLRKRMKTFKKKCAQIIELKQK